MEVDKQGELSPLEFRLDARSGVATYLQIVQQVEQALRLGTWCRVTGCRRRRTSSPPPRSTPTRCSRRTANLSARGLSSRSPGARHLRPASPGRAGRGRRTPRYGRLDHWMGRAPRAGLAASDVDALFASRPRRATPQGRGGVRTRRRAVSPRSETDGLGKRYGRSWALRDCTLDASGRQGGRTGRPERRGQVHAAAPGGRSAAPTAGRWRAWSGPPGSADALGRFGFVAQDAPLYPGLTVADTARGWRRA